MDLSIVSGTYNRLHLLREMVASVRSQAIGFSYEIILIDAGSQDGTESWCQNQPNIVFIQHGKKLGPVRSFNDGFKIARGKYVVPLNDDASLLGNTLRLAYDHLESHAQAGAVAFKNIVPTGSKRGIYDAMQGYLYPQCGMVRTWLGDLAGWWGEDQSLGGYWFYAGDTQLGTRIWELGYSVDKVPGCEVRDLVYEDELRAENNSGGDRVDSKLYHSIWTDRLPLRHTWKPFDASRAELLLEKSRRKTLRTIRLKSLPIPTASPRSGLVQAFSKLGPSYLIDETTETQRLGRYGFLESLYETICSLCPDLLILQCQGGGSLTVQEIETIRYLNPQVTIVNFNGDARIPVPDACIEIAKVCDLSLVVSTDLFKFYTQHGANRIAFWPKSYEYEFSNVYRSLDPKYQIAFMGTHYPASKFPGVLDRAAAVQSLHRAGLPVAVYGGNWDRVGIKAIARTDEQHEHNAEVYANSALALSISHYNELWGYSSDRLYLIGATGCPVLLKSFPGMYEQGFIDGETCIAWSDTNELVEKATYYLDHPRERELIGRRLKSLVTSRHSWDTRAHQLLDMLRVAPPTGIPESAAHLAMGYHLPRAIPLRLTERMVSYAT